MADPPEQDKEMPPTQAEGSDFVPKPPEPLPMGWFNSDAFALPPRPPPNPALFDSGWLGPPTPLPLIEQTPQVGLELASARVSIRATLSVEPSLATQTAFAAMQERVKALEILVSRLPPPPAGIGHNNPPEPISDAPLSVAEWAEMRQHISVLRSQAIIPTGEPTEARAAVGRVGQIGQKLLSFTGRRVEDFSSAYAKKLGELAAGATVGLAVDYLAYHYYGHSILVSLGTDLLNLSAQAEAWLNSLGH